MHLVCTSNLYKTYMELKEIKDFDKRELQLIMLFEHGPPSIWITQIILIIHVAVKI